MSNAINSAPNYEEKFNFGTKYSSSDAKKKIKEYFNISDASLKEKKFRLMKSLLERLYIFQWEIEFKKGREWIDVIFHKSKTVSGRLFNIDNEWIASKLNFSDFIENVLSREIPLDDALEYLKIFHNTDENEIIIDNFPLLKWYNWNILFKNDMANNEPFISVWVKEKKFHLDPYFGKKM